MNFSFYLKQPSKFVNAIIKKCNLYLIKKQLKKAEKQNANLIRYLHKSIDTYISGGGLKYNRNLQLFKLWCIYRTLQTHKPKNILELGSGSTTAVLNYWVLQNPDSTAVSLEESEHWKLNTLNILRNLGEVASNFHLIHAQKVVEHTFPEIVSYYDFDYSRPFDLIIIDGPSTALGENISEENYNCDFMKIALHYLPRVVMIDNRKATYKAIQKLYKSYYQIKETMIWHMDTRILAKNLDFYTIMVKK